MTERTYTCELCNRTFVEGWTDEEAKAETKDVFGVDPASTDCAKVCDSCYKQLMAELQKRGIPHD